MAALSGATDVTKLNGWFKNKYGKFQDAIPDVAKFSGSLPFTKAQRIGNSFNFPIELALPQGVTYAAAAAGAFSLNNQIAGEMKNASVDGSQILVRDVLDYESAAKAIEEGDEAYGNSGARLVKRLQKSGYKRIELSMWYGQTNLGVISASTGSSTTRTWTFTTASWGAGIWAGMRNMQLDVYQDNTLAVQGNTSAAVQITSVDVTNKKLAVSGNSTDLTTIDGYTMPGPVVVPYQSVGNDMAGVDKIITNSGSLFGINAATYELWAGNTYDCGSAPFTLAKLNQAIGDSVAKGLDEKATVFVNHKTWGNLCSDQASLRKYDAQYKSSKAENGFRTLSFFSQNGELEIMPHTIIKEGEAWVCPTERFMKIGATDLTFNVPGRGDQFFENVPNQAGYELRAYADLALISGGPGMCTKVKNIVNS